MGGTAIPWESGIEKDFIVLAELDPTVRNFHAQPLRVEYRLNDKRHTYVPDFALVATGRTEIHEVKPDDDADTADFQAMFAAVAPVFAEQEMVFCVARESAIRAQPKLKNAWTLWRGLHVRVPAADAQKIAAAVLARPGIAVAALDAPSHLVLALVAQGALRIRFDCQAASNIRPPSASKSRPLASYQQLQR